MFNYYFNIGLIYLVIGFSIALVFVFILGKKVLGKFWGALLISVVGAFLGGIVEYFFSDVIEKLSNLNNSVNIFPPIAFSFFLLWIFSKVNDND